MSVEAKDLRNLLSDEAEKERRARKRATLFITLTTLIGLVWLGFSTYNVIKLGRQSATLNTQIKNQTTTLEQLQSNINAANTELTDVNQKLKVLNDALIDAKKTLESIQAGSEDPKAQAQRVLPKVTAAIKVANTPQTVVSQTPKSPTPEIKTSLPLAEAISRSGFNEENGRIVYRGKAGEVIKVQIHYSGQVSKVTYLLDGKETPLEGESFSFTLDKSQYNPMTLIVSLYFDSRGAGYNMKVTTSSGGIYEVSLRPTAWIRTETFLFYIA